MTKTLEGILTDIEQAQAALIEANTAPPERQDELNALALGQLEQAQAALKEHIGGGTGDAPEPEQPGPPPTDSHALAGPITDANYGQPTAVYDLDADMTLAAGKLVFFGGDPMAEPDGAIMQIPQHPHGGGTRWPGFGFRVKNPNAGSRYVLKGIGGGRIKMGPCLPRVIYNPDSLIPMCFEAHNLDCLLPSGTNKGALYAINFSLVAVYNCELQSYRNGIYWSGSSPEAEVFFDRGHIHHSGGFTKYHGAYGKWVKRITIQRSLIDAIRVNGHALKLYAEHINVIDNDIMSYADPADATQYWGYWPQLDISNWSQLLCAENRITRKPAPAGKFQKGRMVDLRNRWYENTTWTNGYNMRPLLQTSHPFNKIFRNNIFQNNANLRSNEALIMNRGTDWARAALGGDPAPADTVTTPQRSVIDFDGSNQVLGFPFPQIEGLDLNNDGALD